MSDNKQTAAATTSSNRRKADAGIPAGHRALAASILKHIEDIRLPVDGHVLVVTTKTIAYGPRPASVSHGVIVPLLSPFPPHTLYAVLFEDGGIEILEAIQKSLKKVKAGKNLAKQAERINTLGEAFLSLLKQRVVDILLGPAMGHC